MVTRLQKAQLKKLSFSLKTSTKIPVVTKKALKFHSMPIPDPKANKHLKIINTRDGAVVGGLQVIYWPNVAPNMVISLIYIL